MKLASSTFIEKDGQKIDVGRHHSSTNLEPSVTFGEPGSPKATRGNHFPNDWDITLQRFENTAPEGKPPVFTEVSRVEGVMPKELSAGIAERTNAWRAAHKREAKETPETNLKNVSHASRTTKQRDTEPSL